MIPGASYSIMFPEFSSKLRYFNKRLEEAKERIWELEVKLVEIIHSETQRPKKMKSMNERLRHMENGVKRSTCSYLESKKRRERRGQSQHLKR